MKKSAKKDAYEAQVKVLGRIYKSKGQTISEALSALNPGIAKGVAILTVSRGTSSKEQVLSHVSTIRLFNCQGITRDVALKNTSLLFDGI